MRYIYAVRTLSLLFSCLFLLAACSKAKEEAHSLVREITVSNAAESTLLTTEAKLTCADFENCPENVGLLLVTSPDSLLSCTSVLLAPDLIATNSHCLPSAVKQLPNLCSERVQVIFAGTKDRKEEKIKCKELLVASERPNAISPDLALIRLEHKTDRAPFPISSSGINPFSSHLAFKINPGPGASGNLISQRCVPAPNSYRFPLYKKAEDPLFLVGDCPSLPGNSGAPLVNDLGEVVGLFQADLPLSEGQRAAWSKYLVPGETFSPLALGTNINCFLKLTGEWNPACKAIDEEEIMRPKIEDFLASIQGEIPALAPSPFAWERVAQKTRTLEQTEILIPHCFRPSQDWITPYLSEKEGFVQAQVGIELPTSEAKVLFNRYMQTSAERKITAYSTRWFSFSPLEILQSGKAKVTEGDETFELGFCVNEAG